MKNCNLITCKQLNPQSVTEFNNNKRMLDGLNSSCKKCLIMKSKEYYKNNKDKIKEYALKNSEKFKEKNRKYYLENKEQFSKNSKEYSKINKDSIKDYKLKKDFGISLNDYNKMFNEQEGKCKICYTHQCEFKRLFAVDHCHKTDKIRGLLCTNCNLLLGKAKDSIKILESSINYLKVN